MKHLVAFCIAATLAVPALADTKAESCGYQGDIVAAVQALRLDNVREKKVKSAIAKSEVKWPERYNAAIPLITPWVYEIPRKQLREQDLRAAWLELCLQQG